RLAFGRASAGGLGDLSRGAAERHAHLVRLELVDGPLLAFLGLVRPLAEPALHDRPGAAGHALGDVLGGLAPHVDGQEQRLAVLPLAALLVVEPRGAGDAELRYRLAGRGEPQLRVIDQVARDGEGGLVAHADAPSVIRSAAYSATSVQVRAAARSPDRKARRASVMASRTPSRSRCSAYLAVLTSSSIRSTALHLPGFWGGFGTWFRCPLRSPSR